MKEEYREAFSEIEQIINLMPSNLANRIPLGFKNIIESEKSKTYIPNVTEPIEQSTLKAETIIILAIIYRDFLCTKEERASLITRDKNKLAEFENELREKYNPDNIFKNKKVQQETDYYKNSQETAIIEYKDKNFLQKIFDKIRHLFRRR